LTYFTAFGFFCFFSDFLIAFVFGICLYTLDLRDNYLGVAIFLCSLSSDLSSLKVDYLEMPTRGTYFFFLIIPSSVKSRVFPLKR